jgi:hypothetical protein
MAAPETRREAGTLRILRLLIALIAFMEEKWNDRPEAPSPVAPGQVWWCEGVALSFDPYYKRRPVLVVAVEEDGSLVVMPLSSRRWYGQEIAVLHAGGTSYMTGAWTRLPAESLVKPLGDWEGFAAWEAERRTGAGERTDDQREQSFWRKLCRGLWPRKNSGN